MQSNDKRGRTLWRLAVTTVLFSIPAISTAYAADPVKNAEELTNFWAFQRYEKDDHTAVRLQPILEKELLAKAEADECFDGVGNPYPPIGADHSCAQGKPKKNQAYVWGLTQAGDDLWFGTIANTLCLVESGYLGMTSPQLNDYWVCEFNAAKSGTQDFRSPRVFHYDLGQQKLEEKTASITGAAAMLLQYTVGLRSAGSHNGVAFLAGLALNGGVNMFAFDTESGTFLGAKNFPEYSDIRIWIVARGALYTSVGLSNIPDKSAPGGAVLRWVGKKSNNPNELFAFEVVGNLDAPGAYLIEHDDRIYITTWPSSSAKGGLRIIGLYEGPVLHDDGLTPADANEWRKVWQIDQYEPDPIVQANTAGGALASFRGALYWGTMQVPFTATAMALEMNNAKLIDLDTNGNGSLDPAEIISTALGTHRSIALFRGFGHAKDDSEIQVVYGEKYLPTYDKDAKSYTIAFDEKHENRMGQTPLWGASGMGNFFNTYTWAMNVFDDRLFIGTFDWSQIARVEIASLAGIQPGLDPVELKKLIDRFGASVPTEGADLFRIDYRNGQAQAESLDGLGNPTNYGFRTMISTDRELFIGTANPMNLHPQGGWELLRMTR